jgi:group I intron endonuclease
MLMDKSGIYTITNQIDNKIYVGYATNFRKRKGDHLSSLRKNKHKNIHLQRAFNRDGESNFKIELLEEYKIDILPAMEHYWCNILQTHNPEKGYNILPTSEFGLITHSQETKDKISKSKLGVKLSQEHCKNIGISKSGIVLSEETKAKLRVKTQESCKKGNIKLKEEQVIEIVSLINKGLKSSEIAQKFNVTRWTIANIKYNKQWNFIEKGLIKQNKSRLSLEQIKEVREKANNKVKYKIISEEYNIPASMISKIKNNLEYGL